MTKHWLFDFFIRCCLTVEKYTKKARKKSNNTNQFTQTMLWLPSISKKANKKRETAIYSNSRNLLNSRYSVLKLINLYPSLTEEKAPVNYKSWVELMSKTWEFSFLNIRRKTERRKKILVYLVLQAEFIPSNKSGEILPKIKKEINLG